MHKMITFYTEVKHPKFRAFVIGPTQQLFLCKRFSVRNMVRR